MAVKESRRAELPAEAGDVRGVTAGMEEGGGSPAKGGRMAHTCNDMVSGCAGFNSRSVVHSVTVDPW